MVGIERRCHLWHPPAIPLQSRECPLYAEQGRQAPLCHLSAGAGSSSQPHGRAALCGEEVATVGSQCQAQGHVQDGQELNSCQYCRRRHVAARRGVGTFMKTWLRLVFRGIS